MPTCSLCRRKDDEPEELGEFMKKSGITVHYYCLLLATNLPQHGVDHSGILGFLVKDIRKEIKNCAERACRYCNKLHATIACHDCKRYFHQVCGNENGCVSEFVNEFHSYCHEHVHFKDEEQLPGMPTDCWICKEALGAFNPVRILRAYCCQNGYVHRSCMRKYALSAGYYLRCLWCGKKDFRDDIRRHGVFVPDREAQWDNNETVRYADLHRGYSRCDAKICLCPQGRDYFRNKWKLKVCSGCGASGVHDKCAGDALFRGQYTCSFCSNVLNKTEAEDVSRKNNPTGFNYTLFMSKTYEEIETFPEEPPAALPEPNEEMGILVETFSAIPGMQDYFLREMFLIDPNTEIAGTTTLGILDPAQEIIEQIICQSSELLGFSHADKLIQDIFAEIVSEGRELSTDMVDEVMERLRQYMISFGENDAEG